MPDKNETKKRLAFNDGHVTKDGKPFRPTREDAIKLGKVQK